MKSPFPIVGMISAGPMARMSAAPAISLGVDLILLAESESDSGAQVVKSQIGSSKNLAEVRELAKKCDLITYDPELLSISIVKTLESEGFRFYPSSENLNYSIAKLSGFAKPADFDFKISVLVARSPHGQAATWAPTQIFPSAGACAMTISPAPELSDELSQQAQQIVLNIAAEVKLVGTMAVEIIVKENQLFINEMVLHPHDSGMWTIEGSVTSLFEQHLRAILDLPLGDTSMTALNVVSGNILGGDKPDMYRPYLHLLARTPKLKVHQYRNEVIPGQKTGHVTLLGTDIDELKSEVQHAIDYMSGVIDE